MFAGYLKHLLIILCYCLLSYGVNAQSQYAVDTAFRADTSCHAKFFPFWYTKAKRPESSRQLAQAADATIPASARDTSQNGFINLQFVIDCKGIPSSYKLSQTDRHYNPIAYPQALVDALYYFVKGLKDWKPAVYEQKPVYYKAYLAFKIRNGHVVEVSP